MCATERRGMCLISEADFIVLIGYYVNLIIQVKVYSFVEETFESWHC